MKRLPPQFNRTTQNVFVQALLEAGRLGRVEVEPEHLLIGIFAEVSTRNKYGLSDLGISEEKIRRELSPLLQPAGDPIPAAAQLSETTLRIIHRAMAEADNMKHNYVGVDHLLLAVLGYGQTPACEALMRAGLTYHGIIESWQKWSVYIRRRRSALHWRFVDGIRRIAQKAVLAYKVLVCRSLGHPRFVSNPYPLYRWLREHEPVRRDPIAPVWVLTRYDDIASMLRDPRFRKDPFANVRLPRRVREQLQLPAESDSAEGETVSMLFLDPPEHTRVRSIFTQAFSPRMIESMRPRIEQITARRLDRVQASGEMDIICDLAYPLPVVVIAELLGFPPEDYERIKKWSDDMTAALSLRPDAEAHHLADEARQALREYFDALVPDMKRQPRNNLLCNLLAAEHQPQSLNREEIFSNAILLLAAGHETTTNLIGNGMLALLKNPDQLNLLRENPGLMEGAIDEFLRYDSPVQWTSRVAGETLQIGGQTIEHGQIVLASLGAANRDPSQFDDPDRLDIRRSPNRHIAFGQGPHFCLGATLAKMEASIAIGQIISRFPNLRLARRRLPRIGGLTFRGVKQLPVQFG